MIDVKYMSMKSVFIYFVFMHVTIEMHFRE